MSFIPFIHNKEKKVLATMEVEEKFQQQRSKGDKRAQFESELENLQTVQTLCAHLAYCK